jgi:phosphatidylglycerophosphate synthase
MLFTISLIVLALSAIADFLSGKLAGKYGAVEKNPAGEILGSFLGPILTGGIMSAFYFTMIRSPYFSIAPFAIAGYHFWAAWHNYGVYRFLKDRRKP